MSPSKHSITSILTLAVLTATWIWNGSTRLNAKDVEPATHVGTITCSLWLSTNGVGKQFTDPSQCEIFINDEDIKVKFISSIDQRPNTTTRSSVEVKADGSVLMKLGKNIFRFTTDDPRVEVDVDLQKRRLHLNLVNQLTAENSSSFLIEGSFINADEP